MSIGVIFHGTLILFMNIGMFAPIMLMAYASFVRGEEWVRLFRWFRAHARGPLRRRKPGSDRWLFKRHPGGLRPTAAAEPLLRYARDATQSIDTLLVTAHRRPSAGGKVRIACTSAMADLVLVPNMQSFLLEHPALRIDLETGLGFVDVARGEADVALRSRRPSEHGLVSRKLATMYFAPFATRAYAVAHQDQPPASWDWLVVRADVPETAWFDTHLGIEPRLTMHSFKAQLDAVRQGLGVGLIAGKAAAMFEDLVELELPGLPEPPPFDLWLVTQQERRQQERRQQPHVGAVIDWLVALVEAMA